MSTNPGVSLDMSPALLGEGPFVPECIAQALGDRLRGRVSLAANLIEADGRIGERFLAALRAAESLDFARRPGRGPDRVLYRDPVHAMIGSVSAQDAVLVGDISPVTNPGWHEPILAAAYRLAFDVLARVRPQILAVSRCVRDSICANYGFPLERVGLAPSFVGRSGPGTVVGRDAPVLAVGSTHFRDNLRGAIEGFALSGLARRNCRLTVVAVRGGSWPVDPKRALALRLLASRTEGVNFRLVGEMDASLQPTMASALIYAPYLEPFCMPLIHAIAAGVPAVTSVTGACPEVGDDCASFVDPDDREALAEALINLIELSTDERERRRIQGARCIHERHSFAAFQSGLENALFQDEGASAPNGALQT
jgi:glycosyltransferase involved in cell wall biosynthesis